MVIRSEFSGVEVGDHVYGVLREFLNYRLSPKFNVPKLIYVYNPWKRSKISASGIPWTASRS